MSLTCRYGVYPDVKRIIQQRRRDAPSKCHVSYFRKAEQAFTNTSTVGLGLRVSLGLLYCRDTLAIPRSARRSCVDPNVPRQAGFHPDAPSLRQLDGFSGYPSRHKVRTGIIPSYNRGRGLSPPQAYFLLARGSQTLKVLWIILWATPLPSERVSLRFWLLYLWYSWQQVDTICAPFDCICKTTPIGFNNVHAVAQHRKV
jgi:hypothetical protein